MTARFGFKRYGPNTKDIAMHFNDLLMRLRSQGLAGIAAVSTLFGIFGKADSGNLHTDWLIGTGLFTAAAIFWVAIWCLDFLYYNRLLLGAVAALSAIEEESRTGGAPSTIYISTMIEAEFERPLGVPDLVRFRGILYFYFIVLVVLMLGIFGCLHVYLSDP